MAEPQSSGCQRHIDHKAFGLARSGCFWPWVRRRGPGVYGLGFREKSIFQVVRDVAGPCLIPDFRDNEFSIVDGVFCGSDPDVAAGMGARDLQERFWSIRSLVECQFYGLSFGCIPS